MREPARVAAWARAGICWNLKHACEASRGFGQSLLLWPVPPQLKQLSGLIVQFFELWRTVPQARHVVEASRRAAASVASPKRAFFARVHSLD